ncbi:MAG: hypothetical protein ACRBBM_05115 [Pseudomonadaceae bacterium]
MKEIIFDSFKEAKELASKVAYKFNVRTKIKFDGDLFIVSIPDDLEIHDIKDYARAAHLFGLANEVDLCILDHVNNSKYQSRELVWQDHSSQLHWDIGQVLCHSFATDRPSAYSVIMNRINYGGLSGWRLPTLEEIETLTIEKLKNSGLSLDKEHKKTRFWIHSEPNTESNQFYDIINKKLISQRYHEEFRNKSDPKDGYIEQANTIAVTSEIYTRLNREPSCRAERQ